MIQFKIKFVGGKLVFKGRKVVSSDPLCIDGGNHQFTTVPLMALSGQGEIRYQQFQFRKLIIFNKSDLHF